MEICLRTSFSICSFVFMFTAHFSPTSDRGVEHPKPISAADTYRLRDHDCRTHRPHDSKLGKLSYQQALGKRYPNVVNDEITAMKVINIESIERLSDTLGVLRQSFEQHRSWVRIEAHQSLPGAGRNGFADVYRHSELLISVKLGDPLIQRQLPT